MRAVDEDDRVFEVRKREDRYSKMWIRIVEVSNRHRASTGVRED